MNANSGARKRSSALVAFLKYYMVGVVIGTAFFVGIFALVLVTGRPLAILDRPQGLIQIGWWIVLVPAVVLVYYLPAFIHYRRLGSANFASGFIQNTLFGWFPPFWIILLALAWKA